MIRLNPINARGVYQRPDKGKSPLMAAANIYGAWKGIDEADRNSITDWFGKERDTELGTTYDPSLAVDLSPEVQAAISKDFAGGEPDGSSMFDQDVKDATQEFMVRRGVLPMPVADDEGLDDGGGDPGYYDESLMSLPIETPKLSDDMSWLIMGD